MWTDSSRDTPVRRSTAAGLWSCTERGLASRRGTQYVHHLRSSDRRGSGRFRRCRVHAFSGWCVMGTRVSASMVRPLVVLGFLFGLQSPSLAQAPVRPRPRRTTPAPVHETRGQQADPIGHVLPGRGVRGRRPARRRSRVTPDAGNRRLQLSIDAPTFYASTERQLDGIEGARAHTFAVKELPAGDYQIVATLEGSSGVRSRVTVRSKSWARTSRNCSSRKRDRPSAETRTGARDGGPVRLSPRRSHRLPESDRHPDLGARYPSAVGRTGSTRPFMRRGVQHSAHARASDRPSARRHARRSHGATLV